MIKITREKGSVEYSDFQSISEYIQALQQILKEHGDLKIQTGAYEVEGLIEVDPEDIKRNGCIRLW